jgi:methylamine--corrinoid protein Co-methyltransferase
MSLNDIMNILDRAQKGSLLSRKDWESGVVAKIVSDKLRTYGLKKTFDDNNLINQDDGLADDYYRAGFEVAIEAGRLCVDTDRIIKVSDDELKEAIEEAPSKILIGQSFEQTTLESRKPEDAKMPRLCAPLGVVISEDAWMLLMQGIAQCREVDILQGARLKTFFGHQIRSGTPYEVLVGNFNARLQKEVLWRAGREGMASTGVISASTFLGHAGGYALPYGFDPKRDLALVVSPSPLKTSYDSLNRVVHTLCSGGKILAGSSQILGGKIEAEGVALIAIASALLEIAIHQSTIASSGIIDVRYNGSCGRESIWVSSIAFQAISRNTDLITNSIANQVAGPCTKQLLYESAVAMIALSVSGLSMTIAPRSAGGKFTDHLTPLEVKFCGQVLKKSAGMKRSDANQIIRKIIPLYEGSLRQAPIGKSFSDCYDLQKMKPSDEWLGIYEDVIREIATLGVPLDS